MALVNIQARKYFIDADDVSIVEASAGRYTVQYDGRTFTVVGGKRSGGASNEWFCYHPEFYGEQWLPCKSMVEAVRMGVQF